MQLVKTLYFIKGDNQCIFVIKYFFSTCKQVKTEKYLKIFFIFRTFVCIELSQDEYDLLEYVKAVDKSFAEFKLPPYYSVRIVFSV